MRAAVLLLSCLAVGLPCWLVGCEVPLVPGAVLFPSSSPSVAPPASPGTDAGTTGSGASPSPAPTPATGASTMLVVTGNLDAGVPTDAKGPLPPTVEGVLTLFDASGGTHCVRLRFTHLDTNIWSWSLVEPAGQPLPANAANPPVPFGFNNGQLMPNRGGTMFEAGAVDVSWNGATVPVALRLGTGSGPGALTQLPSARQLFLLQDGHPGPNGPGPMCTP